MFKIHVISAEKQLFEGEIEFLTVPTVTGEVGILAHHHPLIAELGLGGLKLVHKDKTEQMIFVAGGFMEVSNNQVTILADSAEKIEDIEVEKAREARQKAEKEMKEAKSDVDKQKLLTEINLQIMKEKIAGIAKYKK